MGTALNTTLRQTSLDIHRVFWHFKIVIKIMLMFINNIDGALKIVISIMTIVKV